MPWEKCRNFKEYFLRMGLYNERAPASRDFQKRDMRKVRKTWTKFQNSVKTPILLNNTSFFLFHKKIVKALIHHITHFFFAFIVGRAKRGQQVYYSRWLTNYLKYVYMITLKKVTDFVQQKRS